MQRDRRCLLTHPGKCHPDVCTSSLLHSHLHRRGPLGAQSSPQGSDPAPARHHGPWSPGKTAGVWVDLLLCSAPGWCCNLPVVWSSPSHLRSPAGWPELCLSYLEGYGQNRGMKWIQKALLVLHNKVHRTGPQHDLCSKMTGGIYDINDGCIPFRLAFFQSMIMHMLIHRQDWLGHLTERNHC